MSVFDAVYDAGLVRGRSGKVGEMLSQMRTDFFTERKDLVNEVGVSYERVKNSAIAWKAINLDKYMSQYSVSYEEYNKFMQNNF